MNWRNKRTKCVHVQRSPHQMACGARMSGNMDPTLRGVTCHRCIRARVIGYLKLPVALSLYQLVDALQELGYPVTYDDPPMALRRLLREIEEDELK